MFDFAATDEKSEEGDSLIHLQTGARSSHEQERRDNGKRKGVRTKPEPEKNRLDKK